MTKSTQFYRISLSPLRTLDETTIRASSCLSSLDFLCLRKKEAQYRINYGGRYGLVRHRALWSRDHSNT